MMDERAVQAGKAIADALFEQKKVKANKDNVEAYFEAVRSYLPEGFEDDLRTLGIGNIATDYVSISYMKDGSAKLCADTIMEKLGVETK